MSNEQKTQEQKAQEPKVKEMQTTPGSKNVETNSHDEKIANHQLEVTRIQAEVDRLRAINDFEYNKYKMETENKTERFKKLTDAAISTMYAGTILTGVMFTQNKKAQVQEKQIELGD